MHEAVQQWVQQCIDKVGKGQSVFEIGGRDINGGVRHLFGDTYYLTCDLYAGEGVDFVGDVCDLNIGETFDRVVCTEVLEHAPNAKEVTAKAFELLNPGGYFIMTCAGEGRGPHSAIDEQPIRPEEHYANIGADEFHGWLTALGAKEVVIDVEGTDLRAMVQKPEA